MLLQDANAWQMLLDSTWLSEHCHQFCQESTEMWALIWVALVLLP